MKISKLILTVLISLSLFAVSTNKAAAFSHEKEPVNRGGSGGGDCMSLPINGQAWFLLVAGLGIGSYVILNKSKNAKLKTVTAKR